MSVLILFMTPYLQLIVTFGAGLQITNQPNVFVMKLSSISCIAAALAAIAGCAITATPFYARALDQVNSFERDLDVHPREFRALLERDTDGEPVEHLFKRFTGKLPHQINHAKTAIVLKRARKLCRKAAYIAVLESWDDHAQNQTMYADSLDVLSEKHEDLAGLPDETVEHSKIGEHRHFAEGASDGARRIISAHRPVCHDSCLCRLKS